MLVAGQSTKYRCNGRKDEVRMSETSLKPVIEKLENLFSKFNEKFYNGEL